VAFIQTPTGNGSGVLVQGGYVVTNAHVVWPFDKVRVVFPDGSEHPEAPVMNSDMMADLAVIGPLKTSAEPLTLAGGEDPVIGSEVYLIGYPAEQEEFPQPAITRGIVSRLRRWEPIEMTYIQTDATIAGGQSGGILVSEDSDGIGISGFSFGEAGFGLVASAADVKPRIEGLISGKDTAGLGDRAVPAGGGRTEHEFNLLNTGDASTYVINEPAGTTVDIEVESDADAVFTLMDMTGNVLAFVDDGFTGLEFGSAVTELDGPHFLVITQLTEKPEEGRVTGNRLLAPYDDADDGTTIAPGQTVVASIDYPGDIDTFLIDLAKGDTVEVDVDSMNFDPVLQIGNEGASEDPLGYDDDSGGGIFGLNARVSYRAAQRGIYLISVADAGSVEVGGYFLTVSVAPPDSAPSPTSTPAPPAPTAVHQGERPPKQYAQAPSMAIDPSGSYTATIRTNHGEMVLELFAGQAPLTVNSFVFLANEGFYDGTIFHRVIENFMIQGGDPTGIGAGGPGYGFEDEIVPELVFDEPGVLAMANSGPNTNGSQFFITVVPTRYLNGAHTIFGRVVSGQAVADAISSLVTGPGDKPVEDVVIEGILIGE
jgi:cyclophilin family peptidyl-prolyl cis-trans isomerase